MKNNKLAKGLLLIGLLLIISVFISYDILSISSPNGYEKPNTLFSSYPSNPNAIDTNAFIYEVKPGEIIEDFITIENSSNPLLYSIYGVDSFVDKNNQLQPELNTDKKNIVGNWVTFETPQSNIQPDQSENFKFKIQVPNYAEYGNYTGYIGVEISKENDKAIKYNLRKVHQVQIKVTDNPQPIPSYKEEWDKAYATALKAKATSYATGAIFLGCFGYLAYDYFKKRKNKPSNK